MESQIEELHERARETKIEYEKLLREAMTNAKNKFMERMPEMVQVTSHRMAMASP
jgi:hypothetical protein